MHFSEFVLKPEKQINFKLIRSKKTFSRGLIRKYVDVYWLVNLAQSLLK